MGLYYAIRYKDGALAGTVAGEGAVFPVAINNWTTTSVTFTPAQSGNVTVEVFTYNNSWTPNGYVYSAVDNFKLEAAAVPEPASLGLLGLSSVLLLRRRRA